MLLASREAFLEKVSNSLPFFCPMFYSLAFIVGLEGRRTLYILSHTSNITVLYCRSAVA